MLEDLYITITIMTILGAMALICEVFLTAAENWLKDDGEEATTRNLITLPERRRKHAAGRTFITK